jgi:hypothetical protein
MMNYKHVNSQYKLLYILGYTKMIKFDKLYSTKMCTLHYKVRMSDFIIFV